VATRRDESDPLAELREKGPRPVYLIDGEERFLVDEAIRLIKSKSLEKSSRDFNFDVFSGREAKIVKILDTAKTFPAFARRRLVVVEQADKLDLDESEPLLRYLADPAPTTTLVFVGERFDARTKVYKAFQRSSVVIRFNRPREREMPELIRNRARLAGIKIEEPAVRALVDAVGADAGAAIQALELLSLYVGPASGRAIGPADVEAVIAGSREESIFALADAIGKQDKTAAFRGLHAMLSVSREHPLRVLAMIARHWRNLLRARSLIDAGVPRPEIERAVGIPPYFLDSLLAQARRRTVGAFAAGLSAISEVDETLKGGPLDDTRAMERLVLALMA
jgi:DNA polymerase III subunit delta